MFTNQQDSFISRSTVDRERFQKDTGIVGRSVEVRNIIETILQVAPTELTVLITGESGTGKEVIAKAVHSASARSSRKFVPVNCGAIPEGILESELFGHEKGAFTGAVESRKGYFEIADGGTIFLDEIGDTPIATQVKLLRILENGEFMRVGSSDLRQVDVRVIAATNKDLEAEVQTKRFRQDLFFRLRSINLRIPPLRNRRSDIPILVEAFLAETRRKDPANRFHITDDGMAEMLRYHWPGNIRELKNFVESLGVLEYDNVVDAETVARYLTPDRSPDRDSLLPMLLGKSSDQAERELILRALLEIRAEIVDLRRAVERGLPSSPAALPAPESSDSTPFVSLDDYSMEEIERIMIARSLDRYKGNRRLAAQSLGISERTLYRKIQEYGLG